MMKSIISFLTSFALAASSAAYADMTANYVGPEKVITIKIEVNSDGDVRGGTSNPNSYFITRDGQGYVVQAGFNGPAVMRVEDMATVMAEQMKKLVPDFPADLGKGAAAFDLVRGGVVTIRGRQGIAYYMTGARKREPTEQPIVVISTDPALAPLAVAMEHQFTMSIAMMGQVFGNANPFKGIQDILKTGAPLIFTGMELDTIAADPIPAARFELPTKPLTIDGVRKNMGGLPQ